MRLLLYDDALTVVVLCAAWHGSAYMHSCLLHALYGNQCCWQEAGPDDLWLYMLPQYLHTEQLNGIM